MTLISAAFFFGWQVLSDKGYDGAAADVWSCGVIIFVLMAGYLPFDEPNLMTLYKRVRVQTIHLPLFLTVSNYFFNLICGVFQKYYRYVRLSSTARHGSRQVPRRSLSVFSIPALLP